MKQPQLSIRTAEILIGLVATALIAAGLLLYAREEPARIALAQAQQTASSLDAAMTLYAENCSVCHGLAGEGLGATPALNRPALQSMDSQELAKAIARGRANTAMPAWSQADGGPLSEFQVSQLVLLVQQGDWSAVQERVVNLGLAPRIPFTTQPDAQILAAVKALPNGDVLAHGLTLYAQSCVACHGTDGAGTSLAPAINRETTRARSLEELTRILTSGVAGTRMAAWGSKLTSEEINALVTLVKNWDQVPAGAVPVPDRPVAVTQESLALGSSLYTTNCSRCHGPQGQGTQRAPALNVQSFFTRTNDPAMQLIIQMGVANTAMPAWGDRLTEAEIQAIVGFIRSWEPTAPAVATPLRGPWWRSSSGQGFLPSGGLQPTAVISGTGQLPAKNSSGQTGAPASQTIDWRSVLLVVSLLLLSGTLITYGLFSVRQTQSCS